MAYEKTTWVDGETEIDAQKLNKMEEGIVEASQTGGILTGTIVAYDGDTIPEGYKEVNVKNIITCGINENYTLPDTQTVGSPETSAVIINKIGTQLSVVDGRIKIGKGIKKIKFYGNMAVKTTTAGKKACLQITIKYASGGDKFICSQSIYCPVVDFPFNTGVAPFLLDVNEGDMIFFRNYLEKGITVQKENTNITVEAVG